MPKDEFDFEDPLELNGVAFLTEEDTTEAMCECFVEEFMRMGYNPKQVLALFRNPHYLGMNMVLQKRGEPYVRDAIGDIFARWGRPVVWSTGAADVSPAGMPARPGGCPTTDQAIPLDDTLSDPMGAAVPKLQL